MKAAGFTRFRLGSGFAAFAAVFAISVAGMLGAARGGQFSPATTTDCSTAAPCISVANKGNGAAIEGAALKASGIVGKTAASSKVAVTSGIFVGIRGVDSSRLPAGQQTNYSAGVLGTSTTGFGAYGFSSVHAGVVGTTFNPSGKDNYGTGGIEGLDSSTDGGQSNSGVLGISGSSNGVQGISNNPSATAQFGRAAVFGIDASTDGGQRNWGVAGFSRTGTGVLGISIATPQLAGAPFASALLALCENGGPSIEAADGISPSSNLFLLADCAGNLTIKGTVMTGSPPLVTTKAAGGADVAAYAPRQTEPTIEDFGRSQLRDGSTRVELRRDFAATIDSDPAYLVLITPEGDSRGLYVERKTAGGFVVRESQGGRSSIAFSYRIVAKPRGNHDARLPLVSDIVARNAVTAHHPAPRPLDVIRQVGGVGRLLTSGSP